MQVIGMMGCARAGKTYLGKEIARVAYERGMQPRQMSVADPLRRAAAELGITKDGTPELYRKFMQVVGTDILRDPGFLPGLTGPEFHTNLTRQKLMSMPKAEVPEMVAIFDDVRFMEEVDMIRAVDGVLIYVDREQELPDPAAEFRRHSSEALANALRHDHDRRQQVVSYTVSSTGTLEEFYIRVRPFIPVWLGLEAMGLPRSEG